jgi:hypothetical protein
VAGRRQFAVCEVVYDAPGNMPRVKWTAFRAAKDTAVPVPLLSHQFRGGQTFAGF